MYDDWSRKISVCAMMFILVMGLFVPVMTSYARNLPTQLSRDNTHWWNPEWPYRKLITIDHTKVTSNLTDFPVLISISSDSELAAAAQPTGQDIVFVWYYDNSTILNHEIEFFNHANGQLVAWANMPSLSTTSDTRIWMYYGNLNAGNQQHVEATWDVNFLAVHHLAETSGLAIDSTAHNNDGVPYGCPNQDIMGKLDGADYFDGINDHFILPRVYTTENSFTFEAWIYAQAGARYFISQRSNVSLGVFLQITSDSFLQYYIDGVSDGKSVSLDTWYYVVLSYDGSMANLYVNGVVRSILCAPPTWPSEGLYLGDRSAGSRQFHGTIDEVRCSNIARSSGWITTCFNNQNDSASFYSIGTEDQYQYTLTVTVDPIGGGFVTAFPAPPYSYNAIVTLTAVANPGYRFDHWSGDLMGNTNPATIAMDDDKIITAHFTQNVYTLTLTVDPVDGGIISVLPAPPYHYNDVVTLAAIANPGYTFDYWSGDLTGGVNPATLIMDSNKTVVASFISTNTPPVAMNDSVLVLENSLNNSIDVLANDYDSDGDALMIVSVSQPSHGVSSEDGSYVYYTPHASYIGLDSFTYTISDGQGGNAVATVFITILPANTPPYVPNTPDPENGTTNVSIGADFGWTGGDPDPGNIVQYDVFFGMTPSPLLVSSNQSTTTYDPGILAYDTTYYWRIVSWDDHSASSTGPLWHFTTEQKEEGITVTITRPRDHSLYLRNIRILPLPRNTILVGPITIIAKVTADAGVDRVDFFIDGKLKKTDTSAPYTYHWGLLKLFKHVITVRVYDINAKMASDELMVMKW